MDPGTVVNTIDKMLEGTGFIARIAMNDFKNVNIRYMFGEEVDRPLVGTIDTRNVEYRSMDNIIATVKEMTSSYLWKEMKKLLDRQSVIDSKFSGEDYEE